MRDTPPDTPPDTPQRPVHDTVPAAPGGDAARAARPRCTTCQRPLPGCLCRWVCPTDTALSVLVLQHPAEQHQAKGSVRLLQLSLGHCQVEVGERFDPVALARWLAAPPRSVLLYPVEPGDPAATAPALPLADPAGWRLVLLDGTWRQTRQLLRLNPLLQALPRWALPAPPPSRYAIRRAQRPEQRSTLEAACLALATLQGDVDRFSPLLAAFDGWVASELARRPAARPPP